MNNFKESHHIPMIVTSSEQAAGEDMFNGNITSDIFNMSSWREAYLIVKKLDGAVGTATVTCESCDDTTPTTNTAVAFEYRKQTTPDTVTAWTAVASTGQTIAAGANEIWEFRITSEGLSGTDKYCRWILTEDDSTAVDGTVFCLLTNPRYAKDIPDTVLT